MLLRLFPGEIRSKSKWGRRRAVREVNRLGGNRTVSPCLLCSRTPQLQHWNFFLSEEVFVTFQPVKQKMRYSWSELEWHDEKLHDGNPAFFTNLLQSVKLKSFEKLK